VGRRLGFQCCPLEHLALKEFVKGLLVRTVNCVASAHEIFALAALHA
jgi:hypothetical protein